MEGDEVHGMEGESAVPPRRASRSGQALTILPHKGNKTSINLPEDEEKSTHHEDPVPRDAYPDAGLPFPVQLLLEF